MGIKAGTRKPCATVAALWPEGLKSRKVDPPPDQGDGSFTWPPLPASSCVGHWVSLLLGRFSFGDGLFGSVEHSVGCVMSS